MVIRAVCVLKGDVQGTVFFDQQDDKSPVVLSGTVEGLSKGKHGFHIHEFGDNSNGCTSAGAHYNPKKLDHGSPDADIRHVGDLGNIESYGSGPTKVCIQDSQITLLGPTSIIGRSLVVHADPDDLGLGGHQLSKTTGNAGARVACGVYVQDEQISLTGPQSIIGRTLVVHADPDDLGLGGHELSKTTGNAGARIACGVIGIAKTN